MTESITVQTTLPLGWGNDPLAAFLNIARDNVIASFVQAPGHYKKILDIDSAMLLICTNLKDPDDIFAPLFLLKAHSCYRAAAGLAMAGQSPEAFMVMRGCLESSLYGLYIHGNKEALEVWLRRDEDEASSRKMRSMFTVANMWKCLEAVDPELLARTKAMYEKTIDLGAHPNPGSVATAFRMSKGETGVQFQLIYLSADQQTLQGTMKSVAQTGTFALLLFQHVLKSRYDDIGLTALLPGLCAEL